MEKHADMIPEAPLHGISEERYRLLVQETHEGINLIDEEELSPFIEENTRFALSGSTVSCRFDLPRDPPPCAYDPGQMAQVLDNLVRNAQQAMPMGGVITVASRISPVGREEHAALSEGPPIAVSVINTGIGIPQEILTRIFDPFFTTKEQGRGLGLATCYSIIKQLLPAGRRDNERSLRRTVSRSASPVFSGTRRWWNTCRG